MQVTLNDKAKKLKLNTPMLYTYTIMGAVFSTIEEKDLPWFYSNFIQIRYSFDWNMFIFDNHMNLLQDCPIFKTQYLMFDSNYEKSHSFKDTIINIINNNYYIYLYLDWYYIIPEYCKKHFAHTTLISGYDLEKNILVVSDNYEHGKFTSLEIDLDTVEKAFHSAWNASVGNVKDNDNSRSFEYIKAFTLFQYIDDVNLNFSKNDFYIQLFNYINSIPFSLFDDGNKYYYGLNSYRAIKEYFDGNKSIKIGIRDFHLIYEHKYFMKERIKYMLDKHILEDMNLLEEIDEIKNYFLNLRNLFLKSSLLDNNKKNNANVRILNKLNIAVSKEQIFLQKLLNDFVRHNLT